MRYWYHTTPTARCSMCGVLGDNTHFLAKRCSWSWDFLIYSPDIYCHGHRVQVGSNPAVFFTCIICNHPLESTLQWIAGLGVPVFTDVRDGAPVNGRIGAEIATDTTLSNGCTTYNAWIRSFEVDLYLGVHSL